MGMKKEKTKIDPKKTAWVLMGERIHCYGCLHCGVRIDSRRQQGVGVIGHCALKHAFGTALGCDDFFPRSQEKEIRVERLKKVE